MRDYDLDATLDSGQVFRWSRGSDGVWAGVCAGRRVWLSAEPGGIRARLAKPETDWRWLEGWLQLDCDLPGVLATFPRDEPMRAATTACRGLRLLRQDPWECLISFQCSSNKQIVQIRQMIAMLCARFGGPTAGAGRDGALRAFPSAEALGAATEAELRDCKLGFRAPYILETARRVAGGGFDLARVGRLPLDEARAALTTLPGVGPKIADCVLLFAYDFPAAFPVDVWVRRALRRLYFRGRDVPVARLREFAAGYFGPFAGYAQQYLFHHIRVHPSGES